MGGWHGGGAGRRGAWRRGMAGDRDRVGADAEPVTRAMRFTHVRICAHTATMRTNRIGCESGTLRRTAPACVTREEKVTWIWILSASAFQRRGLGSPLLRRASLTPRSVPSATELLGALPPPATDALTQTQALTGPPTRLRQRRRSRCQSITSAARAREARRY